MGGAGVSSIVGSKLVSVGGNLHVNYKTAGGMKFNQELGKRRIHV